MIRAYVESDIDTLADIWYNGSLQAHHFIEPSYWALKIDDMKRIYIPLSDTHVYQTSSVVIGFISMVDNYLAALFVDPTSQNNGAGSQLLKFEKERRSSIQLKVYQKNPSAVRFYEKNGFRIKGTEIDEQTGQEEYVMEWKAKASKGE
ncbi:acetyltransferase [Sporosarcina sp. NCCP-2716]|uniref:GNAT family N-acetyltransferase n=1 Tax=Sporosarcina sp. NCCP-2716 TaxID=2943679 RepID=UPI00203B3D0F|nr:GNAT family N-acetyltransferase [Sporosarcina sp. NCCP-2716]GKV70121.1 acetyltransferase [Sporosarcina sp. NCCP-2716]